MLSLAKKTLTVQSLIRLLQKKQTDKTLHCQLLSADLFLKWNILFNDLDYSHSYQ